IANRLKVVLNHIIFENQSAFIPGRLISDNIMIAFEVMHYWKRKRKGKEGFMALKLDL
uniref:Reverse transcriptase n=1 Tax=Cannabis sativa TaxID=3483 RepID=A0A803PDH7_CANSA